MKTHFPLANNKKLRQIVLKCKKLMKNQNNPKPIKHKPLIRNHGINTKNYLDKYSILMNTK